MANLFGTSDPQQQPSPFNQGIAPLVNFAKSLMGSPAAQPGNGSAVSAGVAAVPKLPAPMQRALDTIPVKVAAGKPYQDAIASVGDHDPSTVTINDPGKFSRDPTQVMAHEATHLLQNNLTPSVMARIPADDPNDPYNVSDVDQLRKMGKTLWDLPREKEAAVIQRYAVNQNNPAERARLQPWMDDVGRAPLSITMPTAPDAKRLNMNPRPPGLPDLPETMFQPTQPRRRALK
jgi:hypothetical protein